MSDQSAMTNNPSLVEASIDEQRAALSSGGITSVELVAKYLRRISHYDCRGPSFNAIPILNPHVFDEAAASDDLRAAGLPPRPLEGIPFTVKDSYKVKGLTVASGSPAFKDLVATEDAFTVARLREAGAARPTCLQWLPVECNEVYTYGRAESPYNSEYLTAAFASGSSNGSATATAASFAAFGMAEETVSSGRSPASNNGLVAYTPSRGMISIRGNWPLYPTCDVVVPHTRTVSDMFEVLDVIIAPDEISAGDFWREQKFVQLPDVSAIRPKSYTTLVNSDSLKGKRIGVPRVYIGHDEAGSKHVETRQSVLELWARAKIDLESLGVTIVETDFPVVTNYETETFPGQRNNVPGVPDEWNNTERGVMVAYAWDDYLKQNNDSSISSLTHVDPGLINPAKPPDHPQVKYSEPANAVAYASIPDFIAARNKSDGTTTSILDIPGVGQALKALEATRKRDFENWLLKHNLDAVVFPANGDVGRADADINDDSARHAWTNGVKYSNGNRALRHLGIPTVTVTMGRMSDTGMPVGLTFAGAAYNDNELLKYAYAYEQKSQRREPPPLAPSLASDINSLGKTADLTRGGTSRPTVNVKSTSISAGSGESFLSAEIVRVRVAYNITASPDAGISNTTATVDGNDVLVHFDPVTGDWFVDTEVPKPSRPMWEDRVMDVKLAMEKIMVVLIVKTVQGVVSGIMTLL